MNLLLLENEATFNKEKSCIQETPKLSTDANSITNIFFVFGDKGADTVTVTVTATDRLLLSQC